ncbi:LamG domain-containing protein [Candidatus Wolfebacteria bacterium]|nr:LamG domain-containing protein [Candidatus Wolfebacteria bacterium]
MILDTRKMVRAMFLGITIFSVWGILGLSVVDAAIISKPATNLGLVGYWSMNEGTGSFAGDSSGNKNTGVLTNGPTWVDGKRGKALSFDGVDDWVMIPGTNLMPSYITLSAWVKVVSTTAASENWVMAMAYSGSPYESYGFRWILSGSQYTLRFDTSITDTAQTAPLSFGTMYHFVGTYDGSVARLYVNGVLAATGNGTGVLTYSGNYPFYIGTRNSTSYVTNIIADDVRIYNRALSADEVKALYRAGAVKYDNPTTLGLVGYWSMNEGTSTYAGDSSGNRNTGVFPGGTSNPTWVDGKRGKALRFDGSNDSVNMGDPPSEVLDFGTNSFSYGGWIYNTKLTSSDGIPVGKYNGGYGPGYDIELRTNKMTVLVYDGTIYKGISLTTSPPLDRWVHFFAVVDRTTNYIKGYKDGVFIGQTDISTLGSVSSGNSFRLNGYAASAWGGLIDDVRIYNRALSASEIQALYRSGSQTVNVPQNNRIIDGLVGFWSFNGPDLSGVTAYDRSGQGNNGTLINGPSIAIGKIGQALSFDGVNYWIDGITQPSIQISPNIFTIVGILNPGNQTSRFITPNSAGIDQYIQYDATNRRLDVGITEFADINNRLRSSTSGSIPIDAWTHWAVSINNKNIKIYINGVLNSEFNESIDIADWTGNWRIGQRGNSTFWYKGKLDEVRVYNRALNPDEVKRLYNMGR